MIEIKYVEEKNKDFWYSLDKHLPENEFEKKVRDKYVIKPDENLTEEDEGEFIEDLDEDV